MPNSFYVQDLLSMLTGRQRAKLRGRLKRRFGLNRRQVGAIGAGHLEEPIEYGIVLLGVLELIRSRRAALRAATPSRRPTTARKGRTGGVYTLRALALLEGVTSTPRSHRAEERIRRRIESRRNP